jgi:serine/threonine protein kinase
LANFRLDRLIGRGGMAKVYYGWDLNLQRPAAIKLIDERIREDPSFRERFLREARAMAGWRHPHLPQVYQAGEENGIPYFAMEYIPGLDLARLLDTYRQRGELPPQNEVLRIGRAVAGALDYAHAHGSVHRDVKPANILVAQDGRIFLTDFGLVMHLEQGTTGDIFGSPHYIAPEQARSSALVVPQSDLYGLGVVLYELLTGSRPFDDPEPAAVAWKQVNEPPPPPRTSTHD